MAEGSVLDRQFLETLGTWDIVYSWGVLHHTGQMRAAFGNIAPLVQPGGQLLLAIYNDQGGLVEGNSPFQVAWLPDERKEQYLAKIAERAAPYIQRFGPPIVFEGNAPADIRKNAKLMMALDAWKTAASEAPTAPQRMAANGVDREDDGKGGLADRMRALQTRASRLSTSS